MSRRRTVIEGVTPVTYDQAKAIPGFLEFCAARPSTAKNLRTRNREAIPWEILGQLLMAWWRLDGQAQRERIATEATLKAREEVGAEAMARISEAVSQIGQAGAPPGRAAPKRKIAGARRRR